MKLLMKGNGQSLFARHYLCSLSRSTSTLHPPDWWDMPSSICLCQHCRCSMNNMATWSPTLREKRSLWQHWIGPAQEWWKLLVRTRAARSAIGARWRRGTVAITRGRTSWWGTVWTGWGSDGFRVTFLFLKHRDVRGFGQTRIPSDQLVEKTPVLGRTNMWGTFMSPRLFTDM